MKRVFLIDAYALVFKYYYAFLGRPMRNREGMNTSILFGFAKFLRDIQRRERPDMLGVAMDPKGGSFRSQLFADYKANRPETPEDIIASVPYLCRLIQAMRIPLYEVEGYEADDVIGTLAFKGAEQGYEVFMVTPDKDYGQLVGERRKIYKQSGDGVEVIDSEAICTKYGISDPLLVRDILAIWGDASDNIPGVPGIGEKGASKLVAEWGECENILANAASIRGKQGEKIAAWGDKLLLAKELTTIRTDVPVEFDAEALAICPPDYEALRVLYTELNFTSMLRELEEQQRQAAAEPNAELTPCCAERAAEPMQGDLFATFAPQRQAAAVANVPKVEAEVEMADEPHFNTIENTPHTYHLVQTAEQLRDVVAEVSRAEEFCFDTETTGFDIYADRIVGLSLAIKPFEAWYVAFNEDNQAEFAGILKPLFENPAIAKVAQNMKFDMLVLRRLGIDICGSKIDTMILHYLLDAESHHNMNYLAERYLNYSPIPIEKLIGRGPRQLTMDRLAPEVVKDYACEDADITLRLKQVLWQELCREGLERLYRDIEEPMIEVLADMEYEGVKVDCDHLARYGVELWAQLGELEQYIRREADEPMLNVNSARQLGEVLFAKLRITDKPKMTKTKQYSTDEEYLQGFAHSHPIVAKVLEYRGVKKLLSTYVEALPLLVNSVSGRIHTSYNQAVTATGRLSSTNPNLQNIPVREALGRRIREAFVPSDEEHLLLSADYSQVELRLMAHLSGDESLIEAFRRGEDIHAATAAKIFHRKIEEVSTEERRRAKTANFGIIYGISAFGLSQRLDIPRGEARELIEGYFASYPKVKSYMERVVSQARDTGAVETLFGRKRRLPDILSRNAVARGVAERNAINAPIQGTAADVMKLAMIEIHRRFRSEGIRSKMILQVHDEVVIDMLRSEQERVETIVREAMEGAVELQVPLLAEAGVGKNWLEAH